MDKRNPILSNLRGLGTAWATMSFALYGAAVLAGLLFCVGALILHPGDNSLAANLTTLAGGIVFWAVYSLPAALVMGVLALPLLAVRSFIVGGEPPRLKLGYAAVVLYGPAILAAASQGWNNFDWWLLGLYEFIALAASLLYLWLTRHAELAAAEG